MLFQNTINVCTFIHISGILMEKKVGISKGDNSDVKYAAPYLR